MLPKTNKILPSFRESSSNCPLMIVASMCSMLSEIKHLHKEKPKVTTNMSNKRKCGKMKR